MNAAESAQNYPPLPAGPPPAEEVARAQYVSFVFPKQMTFSRPWMRLVGAKLDESGRAPTLAFLFGDLLAVVKFPAPETESPLGYWQSYLDGKLTAIEHLPGRREIQVRHAELPEMAHAYPPTDPGLFPEDADDRPGGAPGASAERVSSPRSDPGEEEGFDGDEPDLDGPDGDDEEADYGEDVTG